MKLPDMDEAILDEIIVGRVQPHIYAFTTNTIPNYLKVGDTYRPVATRLREWKHHFPNLHKEYEEKATVTDDVFFRDYAVHRYLETDLGKVRLASDDLDDDIYYSQEFFGDTSASDVEDAITDIRNSYESHSDRYDYYDATQRLPVTFQYVRGPDWTLRPNQQDAVDRFVEAVRAGRTNLLMYAVMRFGKSFTSLCCAKAMQARIVLVVSAKADVKTEWKNTVETAGNFAGYEFYDSESLSRDSTAIKTALDQNRVVVVFLTLQDLQGPDIKDKHEELFESTLDLLIVDETHFGARAEQYGRVLKDAGLPADDSNTLARGEDDLVDLTEAGEQLKVLKPRVRLHLSGTPYRILMGSEFSKEDIISFVQFSDIVQDQEQWDEENLDKDGVNEWDNPYFGFPQMVRFAFRPSRAAQQKMEELRKAGKSLALSALLEPRSIGQDRRSGLHKQFKHAPEVLDLLKAIDGSEQDDSLLGFLDYDRIKDGMMCRHMVMVLPYCASCDAMEELIEQHRTEFKNLGDYKIINISGVEGSGHYRSPEQVKEAVSDAEAQGCKSLTLTVNRMLTGSTVEQWDTMLYLKDTSSPQEYDQAIFRLQNQYVRPLCSETDADAAPIRQDLKPQTLLVDFDPDRLFRMQEQKSQIYNVNTDENGNAKLSQRIAEELRISPVITMNLGKIHRVEATNILEAVSEYSSQRSIADEARDVLVDLGVLKNDDVRRVIEAQSEIGSRAGLTVDPVEGDETDIDVPDLSGDETGGHTEASGDGDETGGHTEAPGDDDGIDTLAKKLQTYYQRILFFAMLTPTHVRSLSDIVDVLSEPGNERIARHLSLDLKTLQTLLRVFDPFKLSSLDYKIQNISQLVRDESLEPIERANRALNKFSRISDSEVRTPAWLCHDMVEQIPGPELVAAVRGGKVLLDIASKSGEFALALYQRLVGLGVDASLVRRSIYAIPTSGIAYEFTRRFYEILGLDVRNIAARFTSYALVGTQTDSNELIPEGVVASVRKAGTPWDELELDTRSTEGSAQMEFGAVVGNPPYQEADNDGGKGSARPLYHQFVELALGLSPMYVSMVTPSVWFTGGKGLDEFRSRMMGDKHLEAVHHFTTSQGVFPEVALRGGVSYFLWNQRYDNRANGLTTSTTQDGAVISEGKREAQVGDLKYFIVDSVAAALIDRLLQDGSISSDDESELMLSRWVSPRNPYDFATTFPSESRFFPTPEALRNPIKMYASKGRVGYIESTLIDKHSDWVGKWKVLTPFANNIGTNLPDDNMNTIISEPGSISTETYLVIGADLDLSKAECGRLAKYLHTRFLRFLVSCAKANQNGTRKTFSLVPMQDFSAKSDIDWRGTIESIDEQLFGKYGLSETERQHIHVVIKDIPG